MDLVLAAVAVIGGGYLILQTRRASLVLLGFVLALLGCVEIVLSRADYGR